MSGRGAGVGADLPPRRLRARITQPGRGATSPDADGRRRAGASAELPPGASGVARIALPDVAQRVHRLAGGPVRKVGRRLGTRRPAEQAGRPGRRVSPGHRLGGRGGPGRRVAGRSSRRRTVLRRRGWPDLRRTACRSGGGALPDRRQVRHHQRQVRSGGGGRQRLHGRDHRQRMGLQRPDRGEHRLTGGAGGARSGPRSADHRRDRGAGHLRAGWLARAPGGGDRQPGRPRRRAGGQGAAGQNRAGGGGDPGEPGARRTNGRGPAASVRRRIAARRSRDC